MMRDIIAKCKEISGNNKVTLHGEILIGNSDRTQLLVNDVESKYLIEKCVEILKSEFSFLQVEKVSSIAEVTIKIFAYQKYTNKDNFLDLLKEKLEYVLDNLYNEEKFSVQINILGSFKNTKKLVEFRYLNKHKRVDYKIVLTKTLPKIESVFTRKIQLLLFAIFILIIIGPIFYNLLLGKEIILENILNYIPADHNALQ